MTPTTLEQPYGTAVDWTEDPGEWREPPASDFRKKNDTSRHAVEYFQEDVKRLGRNKDRYTERWGPEFRQGLARKIIESNDPSRYIEVIISHCCDRPSQAKVEDGSDVLSRVPGWLMGFIEDRDLFRFDRSSRSFADRVWLYATALSWATDSATRADRIRILCEWLRESDSSIRESAANALGTLKAVEAANDLRNALASESDAAACEAIADALAGLTDAS